LLNKLGTELVRKDKRSLFIQVIRHLCVDVKCHEDIFGPKCELVPRMCCCVYPKRGKEREILRTTTSVINEGWVRVNDGASIESIAMNTLSENNEPEKCQKEDCSTDNLRSVHELIENESFGIIEDLPSRMGLVACFLGLSGSALGRNELKGMGFYEVLRVWHLKENDATIRASIEEFVHLFVYSEEELAEQDLEQRTSEVQI